jgi:hypothetical protein
MYSHRSFNASLGIRAVLALVGASAFQGSIKVKHTELLALLSRFRENLTNLLLVVVCKRRLPRGTQTDVTLYDRCLRHRLHHVRLDMSQTCLTSMIDFRGSLMTKRMIRACRLFFEDDRKGQTVVRILP